MASSPPASPIHHAEPAEQAIPELLRQQGGRLLALARRMCGDVHQAEDLVQEVFLQAFRKWDQFEGRSEPTTWLYAIASRMCYRMNRRRAGQPQRIASLQALTPRADGPVPDLPDDQDSPLAGQLRRESQEHVERAIVSLPASYRLPLILKEIIGFSVKDVAAMLGLKEATVKTRLHRARHVLREEVSEHLPQRDAPPPAYTKRVCMDLLRAKQEALDRGAVFPLPDEAFCDRCRAVFASMDLAQDVCTTLGEQELPPRLREAVLADIAETGEH